MQHIRVVEERVDQVCVCVGGGERGRVEDPMY